MQICMRRMHPDERHGQALTLPCPHGPCPQYAFPKALVQVITSLKQNDIRMCSSSLQPSCMHGTW
jgi:hypothetical protein